MSEKQNNYAVGPVLRAGAFATAATEAIVRKHPGAEVLDRGSYMRISVLGYCLLDRHLLEDNLGRKVILKEELCENMLSFAGQLQICLDSAEWVCPLAEERL